MAKKQNNKKKPWYKTISWIGWFFCILSCVCMSSSVVFMFSGMRQAIQ